MIYYDGLLCKVCGLEGDNYNCLMNPSITNLQGVIVSHAPSIMHL